MYWLSSTLLNDNGKKDAFRRQLGHAIYYMFLGWNKEVNICPGKEIFSNYFLASQ